MRSKMYTAQKKFRITYYIIFVDTILNCCSFSGREGNFMKLHQQHQWACESTCTNFQDNPTVILENPQNRVFPKILKNVKHFKIFNLQSFKVMTTG